MEDKTKYIAALEQQSQAEPVGPVVTVPKLSTWLYVQSTGNLYRPDGSFCGIGYSGRAEGLNNPQFQDVHNLGPIPCGIYDIGLVDDEKGEITIHLKPRAGNVMFGRDGFLMHGDNHLLNHTGSEGCIVAAKLARIELARGGSIRVIDRPAPDSVS